MSDIREKIQKIITTEYSLEENWRTKTDEEVANEILSIVREAVSAVKPKEVKPSEDDPSYEIGRNEGVSDYHDALMEVLK